MAEKAHTEGHGHGYVPAMGHDRLLPLYDVLGWLLGVRAAYRRLAEQAAVEPGHRVLEIGAGTGNLTLLVARAHPHSEVIGLDPDPHALIGARRKTARRGLAVRWDLGSAADLPYEDGSVDRVLSSLMFHHLDEDGKGRALAEAHRVLKPGGRLHLMDFGGTSKPGFIAGLMVRNNPLMHGNAGDAIPEHIRAAGFTDVTLVEDRAGVVYFRATR